MRLVHKFGVNDAPYRIHEYEFTKDSFTGGTKRKLTWICPFYVKWSNMIKRCYDVNIQKLNPNYIGCSVSEEWKYFSNFKSWMETQDWQDNVLDKDLLFRGNKIYSSKTCLFVPPEVNGFILERQNDRGLWPIGVSFDKLRGKFRAQCTDGVRGNVTLGYYETSEEAHMAWLKFKIERAKKLASQQTNSRVATALIERYENYHET